jgi:DNA repair protein RadA/Sms
MRRGVSAVCQRNQHTCFLIGHITKEGSIAGPKLLEHMVDTVLQFEGDRHYAYRILRTLKNRFGSTAELGIYQMK